jgi:hypothetical protein
MAGLDNAWNASEEVAVPQKTQTEDAFSTMLKSSQERALAGQRALDARRDQLLNLSQQRMFNPTLMKFAGGMLAPTKTGSFGESLGYAATAAADEQEKEFAREQALAKLQYEMELESAKQKEAAGVPQMLLQMRQGRAQPAPAAPSAAPSAPSSDAPAAQAPTAQPRPASPKTLLGDISEAELQIMMGQPSLKPYADAEMALRKERRESIKIVEIGGEKRPMYPEQIQEFEMLSNSGDMVALEKFYRRFGLPFPYIKDPSHPTGYRIPTATELEGMKEREKSRYGKQEPVWVYELGRNIPMSPLRASEYETARAEGKGKEWLQKNMPDVMPSGTSGEGRAGANLPPEKPEEAGRVSSAQKRAEGIEDIRRSFVNRGMNADELVVPANEILTLANNPVYSQAMGIIDGPGLKNAVAKAISQGVRVGDWNVGFPAIRDTIMQLKNGPDGKPLSTEARKAIIDGSQKYLQNATTIELLFTQNFMSKQGAITEGERALVRQTGFNKEDSPNVVKAKAKMLIAKGEYDRKAAEAFIEWEKKNPGGTVEEFELKSPERRALWEERDRAAKAAYAEHFPSRGSAPRGSPAASSTVPERNTTPGVDQSIVNRFAPRR